MAAGGRHRTQSNQKAEGKWLVGTARAKGVFLPTIYLKVSKFPVVTPGRLDDGGWENVPWLGRARWCRQVSWAKTLFGLCGLLWNLPSTASQSLDATSHEGLPVASTFQENWHILKCLICFTWNLAGVCFILAGSCCRQGSDLKGTFPTISTNTCDSTAWQGDLFGCLVNVPHACESYNNLWATCSWHDNPYFCVDHRLQPNWPIMHYML